MTIISPSLLSCDFLNIETQLAHFKDIPNMWFHLDIMDGHFVPNLTFGHPIINLIAKKTKIPLDAHFMVTNPEFYIETLKDSGLTNFTFHHESTDEALRLINLAKKYYKSVGISIKPGTDFNELSDDVLKNIDLLLVMSVEPGFGGQSFIEGTWDKLNQITAYKKEHNLTFEVQIDGGVKDTNSKKLIEFGATNLVAGSFVFKDGASKFQENIETLRT